MIILGAGGMAKDLLMMMQLNQADDGLRFFDDVTPEVPELLYGRYPVLRSWAEVAAHFATHSSDFIIGVGSAKARQDMARRAISLGGTMRSVISRLAFVSGLGTQVGEGVCFNVGVMVKPDACVGEGTLVNTGALIGHDAKIGAYCAIAPGAKILGGAVVGDHSEVGTNAVILPRIVIGADCTVGAGAVVTKDVGAGMTVVGIPARPRQVR